MQRFKSNLFESKFCILLLFKFNQLDFELNLVNSNPQNTCIWLTKWVGIWFRALSSSMVGDKTIVLWVMTLVIGKETKKIKQQKRKSIGQYLFIFQLLWLACWCGTMADMTATVAWHDSTCRPVVGEVDFWLDVC